LTDANQGDAFGVFFIPAPAGGSNVNTIHMHWRSLVGGDNGAVCTATQFGRPGADGYSMSWGTDLPNPPSYGNPGEEGAGSGLIVTVDTFDNSGGEAPGLEIKWRGTRVAFDNINADPGLAKDFLRKGAFVEADLSVDTAGQATFIYDGRVLTATLAGWTGIAGGNFMFAARTGGACDNHWIDDLLITTYSSGRPHIAQQPENQSIPCGGTATFNVVATGTAPLSYQWRHNGVDLPGANTATLTLVNVGLAQAGAYSVVIRNPLGSASSQPAALTVLDGPPARLTIARQGNTASIFWPQGCTSYSLEETPNLNPIRWVVANATVDVSGGQNVATVVLSSASRFFRLRRLDTNEISFQQPHRPMIRFDDVVLTRPPTPIDATEIVEVPWTEIPNSLTDDLEARLRQTALQNQSVRETLGNRFAFVSADREEVSKDFSNTNLITHLTYFSHANNTAVDVFMLGTQFSDVTTRPGLQPPAGADEVAAAIDLARRDMRLQERVQGLVGDAIVRIIESAGQPGFGNRVLYVTFSMGEEEETPRHSALVDLTTLTVLSVEDHTGF